MEEQVAEIPLFNIPPTKNNEKKNPVNKMQPRLTKGKKEQEKQQETSEKNESKESPPDSRKKREDKKSSDIPKQVKKEIKQKIKEEEEEDIQVLKHHVEEEDYEIIKQEDVIKDEMEKEIKANASKEMHELSIDDEEKANNQITDNKTRALVVKNADKREKEEEEEKGQDNKNKKKPMPKNDRIIDIKDVSNYTKTEGMVELDADVMESDNEIFASNCEISAPYEILHTEQPHVYTDLNMIEAETRKLNWFSFINVAYLIVPSNNLSARMHAERSLIKAGFGSKLKVYVYEVGSDAEFSRWEAHRMVALDGMDQSFERIAVFECSAMFVPNISEETVKMVQRQVMHELPDNWRLLLLGHDANLCKATDSDRLFRIMSKHNFAYIASTRHMDWLARLTPSAYAEQFVARLISMCSAKGVVPHDLAIALCTNVYGIVPPIVIKKGQHDAYVDGATQTMYEHPIWRALKMFFFASVIDLFDYAGFLLFP